MTALNELAHNHDLTIKPTEKGGGVVVMDTSKYVKEVFRQLADTEVYRALTGDPRWDFERKVHNVVEKGLSNGLIDQKLKDFGYFTWLTISTLAHCTYLFRCSGAGGYDLTLFH